ncbi:MAG TPA: glycosyltransferase family 1 protein, partial [Myxococcaceae bacterium]|nr:glycosyltransferase family 1 protein [Myxococcaceae bacterium]
MGSLALALDATLWDEPTTGISLYARCLHDALVRRGVRVERMGARHSGEAPRSVASRSAYVIGELPSALEQRDVPLFHAVGNFNLPLVRVPGKRLVLTVHDLIPEILPETVSRAYRMQFRAWLGRSAQLADRIICVSERTRRDLLARHQLDASKVSVVPNGADHVDRVHSPDRTGVEYLDSLALPERFVLYAGSLDARKNVALVLDALLSLRRNGRNETLVLTGQSWFGSGAVERRIARLRADGMDVRPLGFLTPPLFYEVMRRASVFAFPSRYEGFGLPPLEAMRLGVPCIVSNAGALPEVCGDAAVAISPDDHLALAAAIERLLDDRGERQRLSAAGLARAARFTWDACAERTLEVYRA